MDERIEIYFSYADEDEQARKELEKRLALLKSQGLISDWHRRNINAGMEQSHEIDLHIHSAQLILLLVSPDFMASDYCNEFEVKQAMQAHRDGRARVIPVLLRPVYWSKAPFGKLKPLPSDGRPVTRWSDADDAFYDIAEGIRKTVEELRRNRLRNKTPASPVIGASSNIQDTPDAAQQHSNGGMIQAPSDDTIFYYNMPLRDPGEFYGRNLERRTLLSRTRNRASTSIVGPRRIGKTWLIDYLRLIAPQPTLLGSHFVVGKLDASDAYTRTIADFTRRALKVLNLARMPFDDEQTDLKPLAEAVEEMQSRNITPVLCIDEFEGFGHHHAEFNLDFLLNLRAMTQEGLVLIIASKKPLVDVVVDIVGEYARTSPFFNVFQEILLTPFNQKDAEMFVQKKGAQANFTQQERTSLLKYAKMNDSDRWHPLVLQLTGWQMLEDKNALIDDPDRYHMERPEYWLDFERRLKEQYKRILPD